MPGLSSDSHLCTMKAPDFPSVDQNLAAPWTETRGYEDSVTPRQRLVELRGVEPLTPRLPALCSPN